MTKKSSLRRRGVTVLGLLCVATLAAVVVWSGRGAASNNNSLDLADLYICRTPADGGLTPSWFRVFPGYSAFEKGALVRYRCTFCNTHMPNNLSLEPQEIVLVSDKEQ